MEIILRERTHDVSNAAKILYSRKLESIASIRTISG